MVGEGLAWKDKVADECWDEFSDYLHANPEALMEFAAFVDRTPPGLTPERQAALVHWTLAMQVDTVDQVPMPGGRTELVFRDRKGNWVGLDGSPRPEPVRSKDGVRITDDALEGISRAERDWMEFGQHAPVAIVRFTKQMVDGKYTVPIGSSEQSRIYWEGTQDLLALPVDERNPACRMDCDESDALRDAPQAPEEARDWDGPFAIRVNVHRPSARLVSVRQAAWLERGTQEARPAIRGPRL